MQCLMSCPRSGRQLDFYKGEYYGLAEWSELLKEMQLISLKFMCAPLQNLPPLFKVICIFFFFLN